MDDDFGVIVESDRDRRTLAWLREQIGDDAVRVGADYVRETGSRVYVSNVAKVYKLKPPESLKHSTQATAKAALGDIRKSLEGK